MSPAPLASQRLELLGQLAVAQLDLEAVIGELARTGGDAGVARGQVQELIRLQRGIGSASRSDLAVMRGEVNFAVAQSQTVVRQVRSASPTYVGAVELANAGAASRRALDSAMDYTRSLSLQFDSEEDERAYREREAERRAYIEAQQARHTPEGDLNAAGAGVGQMADAKAHGAGGPDFDRHWKTLVTTTEKLRDKVRRAGGSTKEFDERLRADLHRIMQSKGLTDAEIDAQLATHPDSLEAAKAFVGGQKDLRALGASAERSAGNIVIEETEQGKSTADPQPSKQTSMSLNADAIAAKLKASGITLVDHPPDAVATHGVPQADKSEKAQRVPT